MPEITAQGKVFRDWEALLGACVMNAALLPGRDDLQTALAALLAQARDLKIQQENFQGNRLATTQQLTKVDRGWAGGGAQDPRLRGHPARLGQQAPVAVRSHAAPEEGAQAQDHPDAAAGEGATPATAPKPAGPTGQ